MALFNGSTDCVSVNFPSAITGNQDHTLFCLIKTSATANDTGFDQKLAGLYLDTNYRDFSLTILNADANILGEMNLHSDNEQEARTTGGVSGDTVYKVCVRYDSINKLTTLNINENPKFTGDTQLAPPIGNPNSLYFGAEKFTGLDKFFKGHGQHVAYWEGSNLTDLEVASMMDGSTKPDDVSTAPDYYYPLVSDLSSGVGGTAMTATGTPTFDDVDLWPSAAGPTITGPDTTTEGSVTVQAGTLLDTVVTQSLISGSYSIAQTIDSATATTLNYVAESGVNQCTPSTPVSGVPLEPTITAAGITPYVVQQEADDGINPPATRNITLNPEATHEVIQTMAGVANTTPDQSIFGSTWVTVEDNHQARLPKVVDGVTFTWNDKGEFTTDIDKTVTFQYELFSPASGNWSAIDITVKSVQGVGVIVGLGVVRPVLSSVLSDVLIDVIH